MDNDTRSGVHFRTRQRYTLAQTLAYVASCGLMMIACSNTISAAAVANPSASGVDLQYIDNKVPAQQDFYVHVNGKWLDTAKIPADKPAYGSFYKLADETRVQLKQLIGDAVKQPPKDHPDARKVVDFYDSFMDESAVDKLGAKPLEAELKRIDALNNEQDLPALLAQLQQIGVTVPFAFSIQQDAKDSTRYIVEFDQDGLGLPDRDYYLKDDPKFKQDRGKYVKHVAKMLTLLGAPSANDDADRIMALETALAKAQWTRVQTRDADKIYNPVAVGKLPPCPTWWSASRVTWPVLPKSSMTRPYRCSRPI